MQSTKPRSITLRQDAQREIEFVAPATAVHETETDHISSIRSNHRGANGTFRGLAGGGIRVLGTLSGLSILFEGAIASNVVIIITGVAVIGGTLLVGRALSNSSKAAKAAAQQQQQQQWQAAQQSQQLNIIEINGQQYQRDPTNAIPVNHIMVQGVPYAIMPPPAPAPIPIPTPPYAGVASPPVYYPPPAPGASPTVAPIPAGAVLVNGVLYVPAP